MEYKELSELYYMDSTSSRDARLDAEERRRRDSEATFLTGIVTDYGELFIAMPCELSVLHEKVLRAERRVSSLMHSMPPIASHAVLRGLVFDEVVYTNEIEGIHSTRRQIKDALTSEKVDSRSRRFRELATLYLGLLDGDVDIPKSPKDIREIYDKVMDGELDAFHAPDGILFRKEGVDVVRGGGTVVHRGVEPEQQIINNMERMVRLLASEEIPGMFSSIAAHFIFENTHPFYDGNGRTGRYLLALSLSNVLSLPTVLSLSRAILEHRNEYYRGFRIAENPLNRGELTFFVQMMLELIREAQVGIIDQLQEDVDTFKAMEETMPRIVKDEGLKPQEANIVFLLMQYEAFGMMGDATVKEVARFLDIGPQMARRHLGSLENKGIVSKHIVRKPLTFALTEAFKKRTINQG